MKKILQNIITTNPASKHNINNNFSSNISNSLPYALTVNSKKYGELNIVPLLNNDKDFKTFKKIITNEGVVFTSSWIDNKFDIKKLEKYCKNFSSTQIGLNNFFNQEYINLELKETFTLLTKDQDFFKVGYCAIQDKQNNLVGGTGLIPLSSTKDILNQEPKLLDVFLHILPEYQKGGIGHTLIDRMLTYGFDELQYDNKKPAGQQIEIIGSSLKEQFATQSVCAQFGMIIKGQKLDNGKTYKKYYINKEMWDAVKKALAKDLTKLMDNTASDSLFKNIKNNNASYSQLDNILKSEDEKVNSTHK